MLLNKYDDDDDDDDDENYNLRSVEALERVRTEPGRQTVKAFLVHFTVKISYFVNVNVNKMFI